MLGCAVFESSFGRDLWFVKERRGGELNIHLLFLPLDDVASLVVLCQGKEGLIPYQNREKIVRALGNVLAENPDKFVSNLEANISALLAFMEGENTLESNSF